eukprot:3924510-Amphidinium_carterae.1
MLIVEEGARRSISMLNSSLTTGRQLRSSAFMRGLFLIWHVFMDEFRLDFRVVPDWWGKPVGLEQLC